MTPASLLRFAHAHHRAGRLVAAEAAYLQFLSDHPAHPHALHGFGVLANQQGRTAEAADLMARSVAALPPGDPAGAEFRSNLAAVLWGLGRRDEAVAHLRAALRLRPGHAEAHHNLGVALEAAGRDAEAEAAYRRAAELKPGYADAHARRGAMLRKLGRLADAEAAHRRAIELARGAGDLAAAARAQVALACTLAEAGRGAESVAARRAAVALRPDWSVTHSDLLAALHYTRGDDPEFLAAEHRAWAARHARPPAAGVPPHANDRDSDRRLRVGYVSPDLRAHPAARFFEPVLANHDPERFEVICYADVAAPDAVTERLKKLAGGWRDLRGVSDEVAAALVRRDEIDLLVDLAGHLDNPRLPLFARKPAPVQATYIGYPDTTGLAAVDYRFTDSLHDPPGETDGYHTERLVRLDPCCWAYRPDDDLPPVNELPAPARGHVTFAALNRLVKVTPDVIRQWGRVLAAVPGSRLMVLVGGGCAADPGIISRFAAGGVSPDRLTLAPRRPRADYLRLYHEVDFALDTFPYAGMTTTCDGLWMGVPTVTLAGRTHVGRVGVSLMTAVGLPEWVAKTEDEYVDIAVRMAADLPRLAELRRGLRARVAASPLADGHGLARRVEAAYRRMWRAWCGVAPA